MTDLDQDCYSLSTLGISKTCPVRFYLDRHCPILREVKESTIHACPDKEDCWIFRILVEKEKNVGG